MRRKNLTERAEDWIREQLASGPVQARVIRDRAEATGWLRPGALTRAKERVGVESRKSREPQGEWYWYLASD